MKRTVKARGRDSPDNRPKPHTCTLGRKFWLFDNGGCTIVGIIGQKRERVVGRLRACRAIGPANKINNAVEEAVSFDDSLGEIKRMVTGGLIEDRMIPVHLIDMYEDITEFGQMIRAGRITHVDTKYKNVDQKVRLVVAPLLEDRWERMKGATNDPSL